MRDVLKLFPSAKLHFTVLRVTVPRVTGDLRHATCTVTSDSGSLTFFAGMARQRQGNLFLCPCLCLGIHDQGQGQRQSQGQGHKA